jgi:DNA polymerase-3 subunit gamma/tau
MDLYNKYRPKTFKQIIGQEEVVEMLRSMVQANKVPQAILFSGPSGCGKTTLARILKDKLKCRGMDFTEVNAADARGIDEIRNLGNKIRMNPLYGESKVILIDEAQRLTKDAQSAILKMLEDPPSTAYFMLATTEPQVLLPTIRTRCTDAKVTLLSGEQIQELLSSVLKKEGVKVHKDVLDKIEDCCAGSARKALVLLSQVIDVKNRSRQLALVQPLDTERQAIELVRLLLKGGNNWSEIAAIIQVIPEGEVEGVRRLALSYANSILIGKAGSKPPSAVNPKACQIIAAFSDNYFDTGKAGLSISCAEATQKP